MNRWLKQNREMPDTREPRRTSIRALAIVRGGEEAMDLSASPSPSPSSSPVASRPCMISHGGLVMPLSADDERVFSSAGFTLNQRRTRLDINNFRREHRVRQFLIGGAQSGTQSLSAPTLC